MDASHDHPLIVLAEDSPDLRALLALALESIGYRVVPAETGAQLVATVRGLVVDGAPLRLIITDVHMPALGGIEAARALRAAGNATPLLLMTAFSDAWTRAQARALHAHLIDKPFSLGALRDAIAMTLAA
jgi:CheY-like chemotaxis protein